MSGLPRCIPTSAHRHNTDYQYLNRSTKRSRKHHHQQSIDDFIKNIKKYNLRSQRYLSSKPLLYMYAKNNTTNTIDKQKSRSLSHHRSVSKSKKLRTKIHKIFEDQDEPSSNAKKKKNNSRLSKKHSAENPGEIVEQFSKKVMKAQKYLQKKNHIGGYLCQKFQQMLNDIVINLVNQLDQQVEMMRKQTIEVFEREYAKKAAKLENRNRKLSQKLHSAYLKLDNNSKIMYEIRKVNRIDVDYIFGKRILGVEDCGGYGYGNMHSQSSHQSGMEGEPEMPNIPNIKNFHKKQFQEIDLYEDKESGRIKAYHGEKNEHNLHFQKNGPILDDQHYQQIHRKYST